MNRFLALTVMSAGVLLTNSMASGQGLGQTDSHFDYEYRSYQPYSPVQVRPSGYAAGYTYTYPTVYPSSRYYSSYRYPRASVYPHGYRGPVYRSYRVTPRRSGSSFGPAHSSQYFGPPHASQYFGPPHASQYFGR